MASFVISGGDFRRTEGCLSFVELDGSTGALSLIGETWLDHPRPHMAVPGKGITGLCVDGDTAWVCFSNLVARVSLPHGELLELVQDKAFNDLHQVTRSDAGLVLANTGNESVDFISLPGCSVTRMDLLSPQLRACRPRLPQDEDTNPHVHHVSSACVNADGDLIVGLGRQARVLNATKWTWIGSQAHAGVHDVSCQPDGSVLWTTVNGDVHRAGPAGVTQTWSLSDYQPTVGWTRGLAVTDQGLLVGTTAVRQSNRDYYQSLVRTKVGDVDACLTWIPFSGADASVLVWPGARSRKIFSVATWAGSVARGLTQPPTDE